MVLLDHGYDSWLADGEDFLSRDTRRFFRGCCCGFSMGGSLQAPPQVLALVGREFARLDRWVCPLPDFFLGKPGTSAGTGDGRGGWHCAVVPVAQGSRLGWLVDHYQHPGLDHRPDPDPRIAHFRRLTRRIDRSGINNIVQVFAQSMILREFP